MEQHKQLLGNKCRVCARKLLTRQHDKNKDPAKTVLFRVYGLSVEAESAEIFPPSICNSCFLVLRRASIQGDTGPILKIHSWSPHGESCEVCTASTGGRLKKKHRGRPSDSDPEYMARNLV